MLILFKLLLIIITIITSSTAWNFSKVSLPDDVLIWRFVLWKNRAYLAIPRWQSGLNNSVTLLEAPWIEPETMFLMNIPQPSVKPFPSLQEQSLGDDCDNIISVTGLDIDSRGRLWVLDSPTSVDCSAKIIIFDLHRRTEVSRSTLTGVATKELKTIVIDPTIGLYGYRGYVGDPGDESIIVYNIGRTGQKWWKLKLLHKSTVPRIYTGDLAVSKRNSRLYLTGYKSLDLFSIDLDILRYEDFLSFPRKVFRHRNASVTWHGIKLGLSSGLLCDSKDGLHYFLVTEYASVRWDTKYDLKATNHEILEQSEQVLSITDYRTDSQKNVWGLVNGHYPFNKRKNLIATKKWNPTSRVIQILHSRSFKP
ncbi:major royal jelly protein 1-like [Chelonus insularis]|uniref:major royal jelly protein 1-like n=1 Tax=Chelonus insularis TaxID=460826 RepID=UPI00158A1B49|nr:major royal jelly protein 1-like [Chelonus insularis]